MYAYIMDTIYLNKLSKLNEPIQLLKLNDKDDIIERYNKELHGYKELKNISKLDDKKKKKEKLFIKYINISNNTLYHGGFLFKYDNEKLFLINKKRKPWSVDIDKHYIFYNKVSSQNDIKREMFEKLLKNLEDKK